MISAFRQLLKSTDINVQEISYQLDALGRVDQITRPYEKAKGQGFTIKFKYHLNAETPWTLTKHFDPAYPGNDMETITFVDGLGRVLRTKKDIALYQKGGADKEMMVVSGHVKFDAFDRAVETYYPISEEKKKGSGGESNDKIDRKQSHHSQSTMCWAVQLIRDICATPFWPKQGSAQAGKVLIRITSGSKAELDMQELTEITEGLQDELDEETEIIFGHSIDARLDRGLKLELIASINLEDMDGHLKTSSQNIG